ncbi:ETC complex I subunit conserved region-domain-containing protein [Clohesyomyces aquaticus]|uniref:ETC complex I subunit conserved region-domain-containing protein n=1 Tax=Clohesyomyces aquaticus TaxID=1231657 RepID=A0A1Y1Z041_9PLEO|nr:ETC complex I subunit conserved region-domain-containing protein [Clohesyomyces aquaticus]
MRAALRLLASVKPSQFLEPGAPTGLTGLLTHPSPRSKLLYLYSSTLDKLSKLPESSVYRQSTEALTKHRLAVIEAVKPAGWDAYQAKLDMQLADFPDDFHTTATTRGTSIDIDSAEETDFRAPSASWGGEYEKPNLEGVRTVKERATQAARLSGAFKNYNPEKANRATKLDPEPLFTADQVSEIESKIGAGLLEEVIQVAEGEHSLVDVMIEAKVWEELSEQAPEGQWSYFERGGTHTSTQKP